MPRWRYKPKSSYAYLFNNFPSLLKQPLRKMSVIVIKMLTSVCYLVKPLPGLRLPSHRKYSIIEKLGAFLHWKRVIQSHQIAS